NVRSRFADAGIRLRPAEFWKHHIHKQEVNMVTGIQEFTHGLFAVRGQYDAIAEIDERLARDFAETLVASATRIVSVPPVTGRVSGARSGLFTPSKQTGK